MLRALRIYCNRPVHSNAPPFMAPETKPIVAISWKMLYNVTEVPIFLVGGEDDRETVDCAVG